MQEYATHWPQALVTKARAHLAGYARLPMVIVDQGFSDGTDRWWLDHHGRCRVVPATARMAVTADVLAQAAAGEWMIPGRRVHTVRHGQGRVAETQRLATEVVGMTGLTTETGSPNRDAYTCRPCAPTCASILRAAGHEIPSSSGAMTAAASVTWSLTRTGHHRRGAGREAYGTRLI